MNQANPAATAALWMLGTIASFLAMSVAGRELSAELGTFQILLLRSVVGLVVVLLVARHLGWHCLRTRHRRLHGLRAIAHFGGQFGWFLGISLLPLAQVVAIEFTTPVWTAVLAVAVLGERMTGPRALAIAAGLAGVVLILRPGLTDVAPASFIVLGCALCYAIAFVVAKRLTATDPPIAILFYMTLFQLPMAALPSALQWVTPSAALWPWALVVGLASLSAHYCVTRAMQVADATVVIPMDFLRLPFTAAIGWLVYAETLDSWVLAGAALMFLGNYTAVRAERRAVLRRAG